MISVVEVLEGLSVFQLLHVVNMSFSRTLSTLPPAHKKKLVFKNTNQKEEIT
jgi:hypothetical protein